ncbi:MAG: hypothetical protein JXQ82_05900 [Methanomicrobiaceae archaeon]|nr:hypothetical protein [Methanomicrobiaceae archaeon]
MNPGEEIVRTSPDVTVKNAPFDALLTNKRIIFVKKTDDLYEKKELVFPLNLIRRFEPRADQAGTPTIEFSIQKPGGDLGDLILRFTQTGDYRYSERDEWIEKLKRIVPPELEMQPKGPVFQTKKSEPEPLFQKNYGNIPTIQNQGYNAPPPVQQEYPQMHQNTMPPRPEPSEHMRPPLHETRNPYEPAGYSSSGVPPAGSPGGIRPPGSPGATPVISDKPSFCRFCGYKIPPGSMFCPSCGRKTEAQTPPPQQDFARPPPPPSAQHPPVPPQSAVKNPYAQNQRNSYGPPPAGFSIADDPAVINQKKGGRQRPPAPPRALKNEQKAYRAAEKQRLKEAKQAEKEHKKAVKKRGGSYDPYAYKESRIPEGLPKIIGIVAAVVVILAFVLFAVNSGMLSGSGSTQAPSSNTGTQSSESESAAGYTPGTTAVSNNFGTWHIQIIYSGQWSGSYTVNGVKTTITDDDGLSEIFGYKDILLNNPSGTIEVTATKDDGGTGILMVDIINQKGQYAASGSTTSSSSTAAVSAAVS